MAVCCIMAPKKHMDDLIIVIWIISLICTTLVASHAMSARINEYRASSDANDKSQIVHINPQDATFHTDVFFGTFVNRISRLSMKESNFDVDFYIWFNWKGNNVSPGEGLQIVNGQISLKQMQAEWHEGDNHYEQYHVIAGIIKPFDIMLFPFDNHNLTVEIEDSLNSIYELQYVPENTQNISISPEISGIHGYSIKYLYPVSKLHKYSTDFGSPWKDTIPSVYSRISFGIGIARDGYGIYFKLFQSLFVAVAAAMLGFFFRPNYAPRFIVGIGALFASVANYYNILSMQPIVGFVTLADSINLIGILSILLSLIQSSISLHMYDNLGKKKQSRRFDKYSVVTFIFCYIFINWWIFEIASH